MQPTIKLDRTLVAVEVDDTVHLMLELAAPPAVVSERPPIAAVVVLDRSGSMDGAPLHAVKEATCNLLRLLGPTDRLGVVVFDDNVDMILPLSTHDTDEASAVIRGVDSGGCTNLSGGWLKGLEMLTSDETAVESLRRIIVLTDGHANAGITDPERLTGLARAAQQQGVTTTTIGFDDGYDEILLAAIADAGAGNDYWCAGPDQAPSVFAAEFEGLASVVAQNISVEIRPADGVGLAVLNEYPVTEVPGGLQVALGDAYGGEQRRVVASLHLTARNAPGAIQIGEIIIRWASTVGDVALHTVTIPVAVTATDDPAQADTAADPTVIEHVNVLRAANEQKIAHERIQDGDIYGARDALACSIDLLSTMPAAAPMLAQAERDLAELDAGEWTAASSKRLFSTRRTMQTGRQRRYDNDQTR